jgi:hypothetical protein
MNIKFVSRDEVNVDSFIKRGRKATKEPVVKVPGRKRGRPKKDVYTFLVDFIEKNHISIGDFEKVVNKIISDLKTEPKSQEQAEHEMSKFLGKVMYGDFLNR